MKTTKKLTDAILASSLVAGSLFAFTSCEKKADADTDSDDSEEMMEDSGHDADAEEAKCGEDGKCGEGKCGEGDTKGDADKTSEGKCGEGKCGEG